MDELQMIREAYGEPAPPTMREMTEARARMSGETRRGRARSGWRLKAGLGVVAVGAAAAAGIATVGSGSPAPPSSRLDLGKQAVLAAAEKAEKQPTGKYWFTDHVTGQSYMMRPKTGSYAIVGAHDEYFSWTGVKTGLGEGFFGRSLPARPLTRQDEAAWRRAGSPSKFRVWSNDHYYTYDRGKTGWEVDDPDPKGGGAFYLNGRKMTVAEIQNLPSDPDALAKLLFTRTAERGVPDRRAKRLDMSKPDVKLRVAADALENTPLPPRVRAGLMRALTEQPGIRSLGAATDPLGRRGVALAADQDPTTVDREYGAPAEEQGTYRVRSELIFNPATGELLSDQEVLTEPGGPYRDRRPGFVVNYWIVRASGWTNTLPRPAAELPF
ncbi:CU044_5270 family protein [Actinomadura formosensis]|uniref:CU044_5270 family protein n=1 Tax=Actinomadura formosensis TaxID=60706 RepID=UPI000829905E|nr:CU044_5270 family protein [Actinomadura formosensis]